MAVRLIALYAPPEDPAAFDLHYLSVHTPIVSRYPKLRGVHAIRADGVAGRAPGFYMVSEMVFDSRADLDAALASDAGDRERAGSAQLRGRRGDPPRRRRRRGAHALAAQGPMTVRP